uniref:Flavin-containing monooxygenase n=1 Tax=Plectus sambesii TaxID=2011161 RepID=A0A914W6Y1_9BILA
GDVERFERNGVRFEDGTFAEVDTVILATGYTFNFPYLKPQELLPVKNNQISLYKYVFPPDLDNLAVIGLIQPIGSIAPMAELQARWATRVFAGKTDLPSRDVMVKDIEDMRMAMERRYTASQRHTLQVDFVAYMDQLAHQIGVRPPLKRYFLTDFRFWFRLFVGGNFPYVYRLVGPGAWPGAREAIETAGKRIKGAVKQRECRMRRYKRRGTLDEYLPYASMKWWASWLVVILLTGLWVFCSGPASIPVWHYFGHVLLFFFVIFMFLMYFNLVYDMSTMC